MRRLRSLLSVFALAIFALPSAAVAQGADVYGVGGGSITIAGIMKYGTFAFSGHTGPQGDFGSFRLNVDDPNVPVEIHVDVDCVNVFPLPFGVGGYVGGPVKKVTPQSNFFGIMRGDQFMLGFNDFGEPPDLVADELNGFINAFPQSCKVTPPMPHLPIDQGNIVVKLG